MDILQSMDVGAGQPATEGARRATGVAGCPADKTLTGATVPNTEVMEKLKRRSYTAKYKLHILQEAGKCSQGEIGSFLRREGLYSSSLTKWRQQLASGELTALAPQKRGKKAKLDEASKKMMATIKRENELLKRRLKQAEMIIDVQKKVSALLGIDLNSNEDEGRRE